MILLLSFARAGTVEGGAQAAIFDGGLDFAESMVGGLTLDLEYDDLSGAYGCYDAIGVEDISLHVPIDTVEFELVNGALAVTVVFDQIYAEEATLYAIDSEYGDACVEFETDVRYVELNDAVLSLELIAWVRDGALEIELTEDPVLTGDFDSDIDWFPDDLALSYFEEALIDLIGTQVGEMLPDLVSPWLTGPLLGDSYGEWDVELTWADADVSSDALVAAADSTVEWTGDDGCPQDVSGGDQGASPSIDFGDGSSSDLAIGVTEAAINELFLSAWRDGYFCFTEENVAEFVDLVQDLFDPEVAGLAGTASLDEAPRITVDEGGIQVALEGARVTVTGTLDGQTEQLLDVEADITGVLDVGIEQALSSFTLDIHEIDLDIRRLEADHLVSDSAEAEALLARFLEEWAGGWATARTEDMVMFSSLYYLLDVYVRIDRLAYQEGALAVYASLYDADDPAVDTDAPDTDFSLVEAKDGSATLDLYAQDDRAGSIAWSWRLDGGAWSSYSTEDRVTIDGLVAGTYHVEVVARDSWRNVDSTPAEGWLEMGQSSKKVCACSTARGMAGAWVVLALAAVLRRRR